MSVSSGYVLRNWFYSDVYNVARLWYKNEYSIVLVTTIFVLYALRVWGLVFFFVAIDLSLGTALRN